MPTTSSAKKALRQSQTRRIKNAAQKKGLKALIKAYEAKPSAEMLARAYQVIDKAAKRHLLQRNTAARQKARLARLLKAGK